MEGFTAGLRGLEQLLIAVSFAGVTKGIWEKIALEILIDDQDYEWLIMDAESL